MFKDIWNCSESTVRGPLISSKMFKWKVGDGKKINFWKDYWNDSDVLRNSFQRLFSLAINKDISLPDMKNQWLGDHR